MATDAKDKPVIPLPYSLRDQLTPQAYRILNYMRSVGSITQRDALLDLGVQSLTRRISEIRAFYNVDVSIRHHKASGQRYARYTLKSLRTDYLCQFKR